MPRARGHDVRPQTPARHCGAAVWLSLLLLAGMQSAVGATGDARGPRDERSELHDRWFVTIRNVGGALGGLALVLLALRALDRRLEAQEVAWRHRFDGDWELGEEYPYCTEPPTAEEPALEIGEPVELTATLLRQLEWKRFEEIVCAYHAAMGLDPQLTRTGDKGGVDIFLYQPGEHRPHVLVQCKSWIDDAAAMKLLAELIGAMKSEDVTGGEFVTAGEFSDEARALAERHAIRLLGGQAFVAAFQALRIEDRDRILRSVTRGDYRTPTCPHCDLKMVRQTGAAPAGWVCPNFPRCRRTIATPPETSDG